MSEANGERIGEKIGKRIGKKDMWWVRNLFLLRSMRPIFYVTNCNGSFPYHVENLPSFQVFLWQLTVKAAEKRVCDMGIERGEKQLYMQFGHRSQHAFWFRSNFRSKISDRLSCFCKPPTTRNCNIIIICSREGTTSIIKIDTVHSPINIKPLLRSISSCLEKQAVFLSALLFSQTP